MQSAARNGAIRAKVASTSLSGMRGATSLYFPHGGQGQWVRCACPPCGNPECSLKKSWHTLVTRSRNAACPIDCSPFTEACKLAVLPTGLSTVRCAVLYLDDPRTP